MRRHIAYLNYLIRHKWFVLVASYKLKLGVSLWRLIKHDWHKLLPSEWFPYARTFYKPNGEKQYVESDKFDCAWNLHQKRADHHWQHWILFKDSGDQVILPMSDQAIKEMVADWAGAGRVITGKWEVHEWYYKNYSRIILHPGTRMLVDQFIFTISKRINNNS